MSDVNAIDLSDKDIFDNLPCGYFSSLPNGIINACNSVLLDITGYKKEEVVNLMELQDFLTIGGKLYLETHYYPLLHYQGSLKEINFEFVKKDGSKFPVLVNSMNVIDGSTNQVFTHHTVFDITQRKSYELELLAAKRKSNQLVEELLQANNELKIRSALVSDQKAQLLNFAHITSHNLRSPVGNLNALLRFYKKSTTSEEKEFLFSKFETVISQLSDTLNELVESVKVHGDFGRKSQLLSFEEILKKTKEMFTGQILESNVVITSDFSEAETIKYPKIYLESIVLNLFSNAIKYRSLDRIPTLHFQTKKSEDVVTLIVQDNGLGIDLNKYGKKLFGLSKTFHKHPEAKGVGLFITKTQVEAMGGHISVKSEVNKGTTFIIKFNKNNS
jgi:PAS domain S-box-containing protein